VSDLQQIDIGLYPIPDDPWVYGKSGLKALQYMALGIPTIASAIGTNFRIIKSSENGILVETEEDWLSAIELLVNDVDARKRLGEAGRKTVLENYSVRANRDTYLSIFDSVYDSNT
jgi:glycosyltransferase involved in cell wall biosynthesis